MCPMLTVWSPSDTAVELDLAELQGGLPAFEVV